MVTDHSLVGWRPPRFALPKQLIGTKQQDAQKTMGIIASLLFAKGLLGSTFYVPFWVVLSCQVAMALGTIIGGWRSYTCWRQHAMRPDGSTTPWAMPKQGG